MTNILQVRVTRKTKKSVVLLKEDIKALRVHRKYFSSADEFAEFMQMDRGTLNRIMELGRSSEVNSNKIKNVLNSIKVQTTSN